MERVCVTCGTEYEYIWNKTKRKYCSNECSYKAQKESTRKSHSSLGERRNLRCPKCGDLMSYSGVRKGSKMCRKCFSNTSGSNNINWHGGRKIDRNGYVLIYFEGLHHRARESRVLKNGEYRCYVPEHVLNWEKANKIPLPDGFTVHHLNGIKTDNRPTNLCAIPHHTHSSGMLNGELRKRIRQLENIINQSKLSI